MEQLSASLLPYVLYWQQRERATVVMTPLYHRGPRKSRDRCWGGVLLSLAGFVMGMRCGNTRVHVIMMRQFLDGNRCWAPTRRFELFVDPAPCPPIERRFSHPGFFHNAQRNHVTALFFPALYVCLRISPGDDWGAFDEDDWRGKSRAGTVSSSDGGEEGEEGVSFRPRGPGIGEDVPGLLGGARFGNVAKADGGDGAAEEEGASDEARDEAARYSGR